jgi:hypothetical protein
MLLPRPSRPFIPLSSAVWLLAGLALLVGIPGLGGLTAARTSIYAWQRQRCEKVLLAAFAGRATSQSRHFTLYFDETRDSSWSVAALQGAEAARSGAMDVLTSPSLAISLGAVAEGRTPLLLYSDAATLDRQFAARSESGIRALGAYWGGVIQLLSPRLWLDGTPAGNETTLSSIRGPLLHEYTHSLLDRLVPPGGCPRWLSEGLAQYVEYAETGYLWLPAGSGLARPVTADALYSLADLADFDTLDNIALAYRQSFLFVAYLSDGLDPGAAGRLIARLARGESLETALEKGTGLPSGDLEASWMRWLDRNLERYSGAY